MEALVANAITAWSLVETMLGFTLVMLLGGRAKPAVAMYQSLASTTAKDAALSAAASAVLEGEDLEIFNAVRALVRKGAKRRNKLAHGVVGTSKEVPDALVIVPQERVVEYTLELFVTQKIDLSPGRDERKAQAWEHYKKHAHVYKKKDLEEIVAHMGRLNNLVIQLASFVNPLHSQSAQSRDSLLSEPEIRQEIDRQRTHHKTRQAKP